MLVDAMAELCEDGVDTDELPNVTGEFGRNPNNPIPTRTVFGSMSYLAQLRGPDGEKVNNSRRGSTSSSATASPVDIYDITDNDGRALAQLFISPYQKRNSRRAPDGLILADEVPVPKPLVPERSVATVSPPPVAPLPQAEAPHDQTSPAEADADCENDDGDTDAESTFDDATESDDDFEYDDPADYPEVDDIGIRRALRAEHNGSYDDAFRHWMPVFYRLEGGPVPTALVKAIKHSDWAEYIHCRLKWEDDPDRLYKELHDLADREMFEAEAYRALMHANGELDDRFDKESIQSILLFAFENGSIEAMHHMAGQARDGSEFEEKDIDYALSLFEGAADLNHRDAALEAALLHREQKNTETAEKLFRQAIALGDDFAKYGLALMLLQDFKPQRASEAIPLVFEAAEAGVWEARRHAAIFYEKGVGGPVNLEMARLYYEKTAYTTWSSIRLGEMHRDGIGGPVNGNEAIRFFNYARTNCNYLASYHLGMLYKKGEVTEQDLPRAFSFFQEAASHDVPQGIFELALMTKAGLATASDPVRAAELFSRAVELGCIDAEPYLKLAAPAAPFSPNPIVFAEPATKQPAAPQVAEKTVSARYVVLDFETTGFSPNRGDKIIEIGAVEIINGKIGRHYQTLVDPETEISSRITALTSITNDMVADAPLIEDALGDLLDFVGEATLVAHNIQFELKFLSSECSRLQMTPPPRTLCTLKLARKLYPEFQNHKLGTILDAFGIAPEGPLHRALPDAKATAQMLLHLQKRHPIDLFN